MFERIEAFRRRKPRLLDDVVTLAHGAGGKASAALLEAVFIPAFANDALAGSDRRRRPRPAVRRTTGVQHRFVRRAPAVVPGRVGRSPRRARHRQRPRHGRRAAARPLRRVRARGGIPDRRTARRSSPTWPRPPPTPASTSSRATPRSSIAAPPTACTSRPRASGSSLPDESCRPIASGQETSCSSPERSPTTAWR